VFIFSINASAICVLASVFQLRHQRMELARTIMFLCERYGSYGSFHRLYFLFSVFPVPLQWVQGSWSAERPLPLHTGHTKSPGQ
jgi:hypothetical protein